ncbi:MAG TPA: hypothetical protein VFS90_22855 [Pyrinomonadaceae bacterium]|nr:hypothetical protein [Pyrinomonadaceae bacterium]
MRRVYRVLVVCLVAVGAAVSVKSQEVTKEDSKSQSKQTVVVDQQTTTKQDYEFPTHRERFNRYLKSTVGPFRLAWSAGAAGIDQWRDHPEEWGQGMKGFGRRYASHLGQNAIRQTVTYGLDEAFGLDTGFKKSTREGVGARVKSALLDNVTSRTKSGKRVFSVPRFAGAYSGGIISRETWYPERYSYKDGLRAGTGNLLTGFGINLLREFVFNW